MTVFGSILKFDYLTQTEWCGKVLSLFLTLSLSISILLCGWKGVLQGGLSVGPFWGWGSWSPWKYPQGMQKGSGNFPWVLILPCEVKFCIPCVSDLSILCLLFAHCIALQPLPGEASSPWFAGGDWQHACPCIPATKWLLESHWNQYATPHLLGWLQRTSVSCPMCKT